MNAGGRTDGRNDSGSKALAAGAGSSELVEETAARRQARWRRNYRDELDSGILYRVLAEREPNATLRDVYARIAATEDRHRAVWSDKLAASGVDVASIRPSLRVRLLVALARRFGGRLALPLVRAMERGADHAYADQPEARELGFDADERSHARIFTVLGQQGGGEAGLIPRIEGRHRTGGGNTLRAAVLGANDGLVSNLSLVMGVAGARPSSDLVLLAGLSGLMAGALSMALGEWISVQSSREALERQIEVEREELETIPEEEQAELVLIYQAKGLPPDEARRLASRLAKDPQTMLDTLVREELGLDPGELGSPWRAALSSFLLFVAGAIVPVLPFFFASGWPAIFTSSALSAVGLFAIGATITLFTGRGFLPSGLRQLWIGLAAALVTFGIGRLVGVATGL
jgi:VIT1/CCC1 family predicted Fe2+/Mn2+ transporter